MLPITSTMLTTLQWVQPRAMQRRFELRAGEQVYATLEFTSAFGSLAKAEAADGQWTFKRVGFFKPQVTVRRPGEETDMAVYVPRWTGVEGQLRLTNGPELLWKPANFWATQYAWQDEQGNPLVSFKQGIEDARWTDIFKYQARVEMHPAAALISQPALLVLLGFYLLILKQQDDAAVTAAAT